MPSGQPIRVLIAEDLTPRAADVLRLAAGSQSNKRIAASPGLSEATVRTHVSHFLAKLGASGRAQAATEAMRRGIHLQAAGP